VLLGFLIFKVDVILTFSRWIVLRASLTRWSIGIHSWQRRDSQSCSSQMRLPLPPFPMSLGSAELDITSSFNRHSILLCHMFGKSIQTANRCATCIMFLREQVMHLYRLSNRICSVLASSVLNVTLFSNRSIPDLILHACTRQSRLFCRTSPISYPGPTARRMPAKRSGASIRRDGG